MRAALRHMISIERDTLDELRDAVDAQIDAAVGLLFLVGDDRASVVATLRHIAVNIQDDVTRIIVSARQSSSALAYSTVEIEATLAVDEEDDPEDEARATIVGMSYSSAWLAAALAAVVLKIRDLKKVTKTQDYRLARIATTEVAQAYSAASLRAYERMPHPEQWMKRWDATLDSKTCAHCAAHDGETIPIDEEFRDGDIPGDVHPRCRCQPTILSVADAQAA